MLVLGREAGQKIFIGDDIEIEFLGTVRHGDLRPYGKIRLGIKAPPTMRVEREELRQERLAQAIRDAAGHGGACADPR